MRIELVDGEASGDLLWCGCGSYDWDIFAFTCDGDEFECKSCGHISEPIVEYIRRREE